MDRLPNHICKYSKCQKPYYACEQSDIYTSWKSMACCPAHFQAYMREVEIARQKYEDEKNGAAEEKENAEPSFLNKAKILLGVIPEEK